MYNCKIKYHKHSSPTLGGCDPNADPNTYGIDGDGGNFWFDPVALDNEESI
jgi:hypothetical protein